jgi:hypothetical protein
VWLCVDGARGEGDGGGGGGSRLSTVVFLECMLVAEWFRGYVWWSGRVEASLMVFLSYSCSYCEPS